jgi:hypothetical protein
MADKQYVLIQWKDGWQEVIGIEGDTVDFNKYYVIERLEQYGRLVFDRPKGEYPGLVVLDRAPLELEKVALVGAGTERVMKQTSTYREGTRLEYNYELEKGSGDFYAEVISTVKKALADKGVAAKDVLAKSEPERSKELGELARAAKILGGKSQEDLIGFMEDVLRKL